MPSTVAKTSTVTASVTDVIEYFFTTAHNYLSQSASAEPTPDVVDGDLTGRGVHRTVVFANPYVPEQWLCADAEWENQGKVKAEVRLQKVKMDDKHAKCWGKHFEVLNFDRAFTTVTVTEYASATSTLSDQPTWLSTS